MRAVPEHDFVAVDVAECHVCIRYKCPDRPVQALQDSGSVAPAARAAAASARMRWSSASSCRRMLSRRLTMAEGRPGDDRQRPQGASLKWYPGSTAPTKRMPSTLPAEITGESTNRTMPCSTSCFRELSTMSLSAMSPQLLASERPFRLWPHWKRLIRAEHHHAFGLSIEEQDPRPRNESLDWPSKTDRKGLFVVALAMAAAASARMLCSSASCLRREISRRLAIALPTKSAIRRQSRRSRSLTRSPGCEYRQS